MVGLGLPYFAALSNSWKRHLQEVPVAQTVLFLILAEKVRDTTELLRSFLNTVLNELREIIRSRSTLRLALSILAVRSKRVVSSLSDRHGDHQKKSLFSVPDKVFISIDQSWELRNRS